MFTVRKLYEYIWNYKKIIETSLIFHIYFRKIKHQLLIALFQFKGEILFPNLMIKMSVNKILIVMFAYRLKRFFVVFERAWLKS